MYYYWDLGKYRNRIENILITTDSAPYTLSMSIFLFPVLKNIFVCSKINCSPGMFYGGVIVKQI